MKSCFILIFITFPFFVDGAKQNAKEINPNIINEKYKKIKKILVDEEDLQRQLMGRLYKINSNLKKMSKKRESLTNKYLATNRNVKHLAREIARLEYKIQDKQKYLTKKLRFIFLMKKHGVMQFLFSSINSHDFDKHIKYLKAFSESDIKLIEEFRKAHIVLKRQREKLNVAVKNMITARKSLTRQKKKLAKEQEMKTRWIKKIRNNRSKYISHIKVLRKISNKKKRRVSDFLAVSFFERKGKLKFPAKASLEKKYGYTEDPNYYFQLSHKGLFFKSLKKEKVRPVHGGEIAYAGHVKGYGKTVIVDHGDHYYTLYASLSQIKVKLGESVDSQRIIGSTGRSSLYKLGLYFEIRHFSDAIDPLPWFDKSKRLSSIGINKSHL